MTFASPLSTSRQIVGKHGHVLASFAQMCQSHLNEHGQWVHRVAFLFWHSEFFLLRSVPYASSLCMWGLSLQGWCSWQAWVEMVPKFAAGQSEGCQAVGNHLCKLANGPCRLADADGLLLSLHAMEVCSGCCTDEERVQLDVPKGSGFLVLYGCPGPTGWLCVRCLFNPFWVSCRPPSKALRHASFSEGEGLEYNRKWAHLDLAV